MTPVVIGRRIHSQYGSFAKSLSIKINCAESTNFATPAWIEHGAAAHLCRCSPDQQSVRLDMGLFLAQAPDEHAQALVKQWVSEEAARRKSAEKLLNQANKKHAALDSQHGCSNKQQQADGSKLVCETRTHATIQGMEAIQATTKGKAAVRLVTQKKAGAVRKPARCTKVIKKAFKHSKAELGSAGKADSKKVAAMLKMAKRAELAPSAAAKMPQLQPIFASAKSSLRPQHAVESPAQARGRPNSSSKARVPATDVAMQGLEHSCYGSNQSDFSQTQQHDMVDTVGQLFGSVGSTDAQLLGKRKRSTPTTAMPEEGMAQKKALDAVHHQVATIDWLYMSGDRPTKRPSRQLHISLTTSSLYSKYSRLQHSRQTQQDLHSRSSIQIRLSCCSRLSQCSRLRHKDLSTPTLPLFSSRAIL